MTDVKLYFNFICISSVYKFKYLGTHSFYFLFWHIKCVMRSLARQLHAAPLLGEPRDAPVAVGEVVHEEEEQKHGELAHVHLAAGPPVVCHRGKSDLLELPPLLLQGLSIVTSVLRTVPIVQRVPLGGGLDGEGGVVAHHGVHLLVWFVVLQQHPILLGGRGPLLIIDGVRSRLPQVIPGGGACH